MPFTKVVTTTTTESPLVIPIKWSNAFYHLMKISLETKLDDGNAALIVHFPAQDDDESGVVVSVAAQTGGDDKTIEYCNKFKDLATRYKINHLFEIEPAPWEKSNGRFMDWFYNTWKNEALLITYDRDTIKLLSNPQEVAYVKQY